MKFSIPCLGPAPNILLFSDEDWKLLPEWRVFPMSLFNERMLQQMCHRWPRLKIFYQTPAGVRGETRNKSRRVKRHKNYYNPISDVKAFRKPWERHLYIFTYSFTPRLTLFTETKHMSSLSLSYSLSLSLITIVFSVNSVIMSLQAGARGW